MTSGSGSVADLLRAREGSTATVFEDARSSRTVDAAALAASAAAWRAALDGAGAPVGAAVVLDLDDPLVAATALVAVLAAGRVAVPVDPGAPVAESRRVRDDLGGALVATDRPARAGGPGVLLLDPDRPTAGPVPAPGATPPPDAPPTPPALPAVLPGPGVVLPTSGSTGVPKLVPLAEPGLVHVARAVAAHNGLTAADRGYNPLPLFHVNAEVVAVLATLVAGSTVVLDRRFHRTGFWELLAQRRISWVNAVPAVLGILATDPAAAAPPGLRFVRSASAALPTGTREWAQAQGIALVESYGMTEAGSQITATPLTGGAPAGSVGRPVATDLRVRDEQGRDVGPDVVGRVWIRGPGVVRGYLHGRAAERFTADGWLDTADLGRVNADGWVFLVGRADDVINRGGELVYPREVEDVLASDPRVRDAVVLPRPDPLLGEVPVAYVEPVSGAPRDGLAAELIALAAGRLGRHKRPVDVVLVDGFPRASTGKIQRARIGVDPS